MVHGTVPVKDMTAGHCIQNVPMDLLSAALREMYLDGWLIPLLQDHRNLADRISHGT